MMSAQITNKSLVPCDLTSELYREYEWPARGDAYRIDSPQQLFVGATTHRVVDAKGVVHCVPAPGFHGCVIRWKSRDGSSPVQF
jgi:hypothetical protein